MTTPNGYTTKLQEARKLDGLTLKQLAEGSGVNIAQLSVLDNGRRSKRKVADFFAERWGRAVDPDDLFGA